MVLAIIPISSPRFSLSLVCRCPRLISFIILTVAPNGLPIIEDMYMPNSTEETALTAMRIIIVIKMVLARASPFP